MRPWRKRIVENFSLGGPGLWALCVIGQYTPSPIYSIEEVHDLPMAAGAVLTRLPSRRPARFLRSCVLVSHENTVDAERCLLTTDFKHIPDRHGFSELVSASHPECDEGAFQHKNSVIGKFCFYTGFTNDPSV